MPLHVRALFADGITGGLSILTFGLCAFAGVITLKELIAPTWKRLALHREPSYLAIWHSVWGSRRRFGGYVVHTAVIVVVAAIAGSQGFKKQAEASLSPGQTFVIGPYSLTFERVETTEDAVKMGVAARLKVVRDG